MRAELPIHQLGSSELFVCSEPLSLKYPNNKNFWEGLTARLEIIFDRDRDWIITVQNQRLSFVVSLTSIGKDQCQH